MTITTKKQTQVTDYSALQEELECRYGPALAQQIIDQIKKTEKTNEMPDYMNFHAMSEILENLRFETQTTLKKLKDQRNAAQGREVLNFDGALIKQELQRLFSLYFEAQKGFYRMYRSAMSAHVEVIPSWKKYQKAPKQPQIVSAQETELKMAA